jgi:type I restriction enzyme S subunit
VHNNLRKPLKKADRDKRGGDYPYYGAFGIIDDIDDFMLDGRYILLAEDGKNLETRTRPISLIAEGKFWVNNHAHVLKERKWINIDYVNNFLNSPIILIDQFLTGQDQVKLNRKAMELIPVPVPPLEEQTEIARRIEQLFAHTDKIEQQVQAAQQRVDKLTQSILAKAFRGELTSQWRKDNPALISGGNSAEALLAKIKAEREAKSPKKRVKTKKAKA